MNKGFVVTVKIESEHFVFARYDYLELAECMYEKLCIVTKPPEVFNTKELLMILKAFKRSSVIDSKEVRFIQDSSDGVITIGIYEYI